MRGGEVEDEDEDDDEEEKELSNAFRCAFCSFLSRTSEYLQLSGNIPCQMLHKTGSDLIRRRNKLTAVVSTGSSTNSENKS